MQSEAPQRERRLTLAGAHTAARAAQLPPRYVVAKSTNVIII